ncbi:exopolysaccharide biosynthesis protein, acetyltransferase [Flavobacteriaceae bacterium 3519-10]|nr:exopolysaccharide biosynthesis protein, acetyltransferase [Flavobacteriaceae bacterium 3519-10]
MVSLSKVFLRILKNKNLGALRNNPNIQTGRNMKLGDFCNFQMNPELQSVQIKSNVSLRNYISLLVGKNAELIIGENLFFNNYCSVNALHRIEIGDNTLFGEGVKIYDHNHQYTAEKIQHQQFNTAPVKIGKNCWLGSNVTVLKGVTIGDNVIIGAGVLVYKDIPANSIVKLKQELVTQSI